MASFAQRDATIVLDRHNLIYAYGPLDGFERVLDSAGIPRGPLPEAPDLGGIFIFIGTLWCLVLVWGASAMSRRVRRRPSSGLLLKRATGAIFVGLGVRLAVSK